MKAVWPTEPGPDGVGRSVLLRVAVVLVGYGIYALAVAATPAAGSEVHNTQQSRGRALWVAHGCGSCHGLVGLGGHLGPDLTRLDQRLPRHVVAAILASGPPGMPRFAMSGRDLNALMDWLNAVSTTAAWPPRSLTASAFGGAP